MKNKKNLCYIILSYNRYDNLKNIIKVFHDYGCLDFYICLDGLTDEHKKNTNECNNRNTFLNWIKQTTANYVVRNFNMGSKFGIPDFISQFSEDFHYFVAIEDDLVINNQTLDFFNSNYTKVGTIGSGYKVGMISAFTG